MRGVRRSIVESRDEERLRLARDAYLAAHQRLADVAKRYHSIQAANWHPIRDEYHVAMMAAVEAALILHDVEATHQREREAFRDERESVAAVGLDEHIEGGPSPGLDAGVLLALALARTFDPAEPVPSQGTIPCPRSDQ